ncbi:MAG TPA: hypothetical protein VMF52_20515 [Steroidobacteraceae bacterium]|nr:hypothetical protein [Steroidobacteraceae bacterium]
MYTLWQAAWRSASVVGIAALVYAIVVMAGIPAVSEIPWVALLLAVFIGSAVVWVVVATAFRLGFRLAGSTGISRGVVMLTAGVYLGIAVALAMVPLKTHAVKLDVPAAADKTGGVIDLNLAISLSGTVFLLFGLPVLISYATARMSRLPASES